MNNVKFNPAMLQFSAEKLDAENRLLGALLREPFNLHQHIEQLDCAYINFANAPIKTAFQSIIQQYKKYGTYSVLTIEKDAPGVSHFASQNSEIDLSWAIDTWKQVFEDWAERAAAFYALENAQSHGSGADGVRSAIEFVRDNLGLNSRVFNRFDPDEFVKRCIDKADGTQKPARVRPHLSEVRKFVTGFGPGELWVIAGRPGMGKTQAVCNLISAFSYEGLKGIFFTLEMTEVAVLDRMLGIRHGINPQGDFSSLDKNEVYKAATETAESCTTCRMIGDAFRISEIESITAGAFYRGELEYIVIDQLSFITCEKKQNREQEIAYITASMVRLAKRLNVPIILLHQLNRDVEKRGGSKRPSLSDLRDSGAVEQDAHGVIFLYRPEYYGITEDENGNSTVGIAECIIAKQRNGPVGTAVVSFNPIRGFRDIDSQFEPRKKSDNIQDFTMPASARAQILEGDIPF